MGRDLIHRFEYEGKRYAIDPETCFCFECDAISWEVLNHYPETTVNGVYRLLEGKYGRRELEEVVGELEWLRNTKSILGASERVGIDSFLKVERGFKRLTVFLSEYGLEASPVVSTDPVHVANLEEGLVHESIALLLGRSGEQEEVHVEFVAPSSGWDLEGVAAFCRLALRQGLMAGKKVSVSVLLQDVELRKAPAAFGHHSIGLRVAFQEDALIAETLASFVTRGPVSLGELAKSFGKFGPGVVGGMVVRPGRERFGDVVEALDVAGFTFIELDMEGAFVHCPDLECGAVARELEKVAKYYAGQLLGNRYFRLEPIATFFWQIYNGSVRARSDLAGTNEVAVDERGDLYPSRSFVGVEEHCLGSVEGGRVDESRLNAFDDVGSRTTAACSGCWVRNLCGGGSTGVHHALTGSFRRPDAAWCEGQRAWMEGAVAAFNTLASSGVNFDRMYSQLGRHAKSSFFSMVRAALQTHIGIRPLEESDAEMLTGWENWNESSYFLFNESGLMLATAYDREMDSLHPRGTDQELLLVRANREPFGLVKVRPDGEAGVAQGWVFMRSDDDYNSGAYRRGFRRILKEAAGQQNLRKIVVGAASYEKALQEFLGAVGFERAGVQRESLYCHCEYHDVVMFDAVVDEL